MRDYVSELPMKAPEGLVAWALDNGRIDTGGLTYQIEWLNDDSLGAILEDRNRKIKKVRCNCSACGQSFYADWAQADHVYSGRKTSYGFQYEENGLHTVVTDGDAILCPICKMPVAVRLAASLGDKEFTTDECLAMGLSLMKGEKGQRPLVLTEYRIRRRVNRYGFERIEVLPEEAWVFDNGKCYQFRRWKKSYSGSCGYFMTWTKKWVRCKEISREWTANYEIFGMTKKKIESSCMHNSRFWEYMKLSFTCYPVLYLLLYQKHNTVENLISSGAGYIVDELIRKEAHSNAYKNKKGAAPELDEIDWSQRRPAQMLHLNKTEFGWMKDMRWSLYHWELFVAAKNVGDKMTEADIYDCHCYGDESLKDLVGRAPIGKCARYLLKQCFLMGESFERECSDEEYNPYLDPYCDDEYLSATMLADYWNMAEACGLDLSNPEIRWPKLLVAAHDRIMERYQTVKKKQHIQLFRNRFVHLSSFVYMSGDLMIIPADSQSSLDMEGDVLSHCVGSYGDDHATGKTAIFFIRHTWAPGEPYFTLEYKEEEEAVKQNRGKRNCEANSKVKKFVDEWLSWIHKGRPRDERGDPVGAKPVEDTPAGNIDCITIIKEVNAA